MVILGLILVLVALTVGAALILGTSDPEVANQNVDIQLFDAVTITLTPLTMIVAGMAAMFVLWLGLVMIKLAIARKARKRRERKAAELEARERREREQAAAAERARQAEGERQLEARRLEEERAAATGAAVPGSTAPDHTRPIARDRGADETAVVQQDGDVPTTRPLPREDGPRR